MNCGAKPMAGTSFCPGCGAPTTPLTEICIKCGARIAKELAGDISPKSRLATTLLAWFLGIFGAHRFYVGKTGTAIVMLLLGIAGLATILLFSWLFWWLFWWPFGGGLFLIAVGIWAFVDFIFAVTGHMKDNEGRLIQKW
jgi:TM2 domain-containing membrane protein YozV